MHFTPRERDIIEAMLRHPGGTNKELARAVGMAEGTVKIHLRNVGLKVGSTRRADIVVRLIRAGYDFDEETGMTPLDYLQRG